MGVDRLPSEGSVWLNYIPSGVSGYETPIPPELAYSCAPPISEYMTLSGWRPRDHSNRQKTIWQVERHFPNGSWDEIRFDNHKGERPHIFVKRMLGPQEKPTREQFYGEIAPEIAKTMNGLVKKTKHSRKGKKQSSIG